MISMKRIRHGGRVFLAAATTFGLAACGGGGGGESLPAADSFLPAEYSAAGPGTGGIGDYLVSGGSWRVDLGGQVHLTALGSMALRPALVYDVTADTWTANMNGTNITLANVAVNQYSGLVDNVLGSNFTIYDSDNVPATSQYGTFGTFLYEGPMAAGNTYVHFGLKTPLADMPGSGTGVFDGFFEGQYLNASNTFNPLTGPATVTADFAAGRVVFTSIGTGSGSTHYSLTGDATITGNTYQGTVTGDFKPTAIDPPLFTIDPANSSLSGAFYGPWSVTPGTSETAGVIYAADTAGTNEIAGGFRAVLSGYAP